MDTFARETFKLGTLRGFKYFSPELRGREEMLLSISVAQSAAGQLNLQALGGSALPPACRASASARRHPGKNRRPADATVDCTFLLAGYAHYNRPRRWIRAGMKYSAAHCGGTGRADRPRRDGRLEESHRPRL